MGKKQRRQRKRHRKTRQWGGVIPLLAMAIPALSAIGIAAALAAASSLAGRAVKKKLMDRKPKKISRRRV